MKRVNDGIRLLLKRHLIQLMTFLVTALLLSAPGCSDEKETIDCIEDAECGMVCESFCVDQPVVSAICNDGECACECGMSGTGGMGGSAGSGGTGGSSGAGGGSES